jgi:hypothetical protein
MSKFQIGDRVRFYEGLKTGVGVVQSIGTDGTLDVQESADIWLLHPKQCRKLKPKKSKNSYSDATIERMITRVQGIEFCRENGCGTCKLAAQHVLTDLKEGL